MAADNSDILSNSQPKQAVYIKTFGCQMNEYDSFKLLKILEPGYRQVNSAQEADLIIINTCSVREKPQLKVYSLLGELRPLKQIRPNLLIGVGGCVAQQEGERLLKNGAPVDFVFGTHNLSLVPALIRSCLAGQRGQVAVDYRDEWEDLPLGLAGNSKVSVFITISRGCSRHCAYCIVPKTRGPIISRPLAEIEKEARWAVAQGAKELVLLGQTVNSYGRDLDGKVSFEKLLERIALIDGLHRIRFTSPHPQEVTADFIHFFGSCEKLCKHIHLPLQAGSDRVLKAMNRRYSQEDYLKLVSKLKERIDDLAITTDLIVGFPGETEQDFQETLKVMREVGFENSFSFVYSERPGTRAAKMPEQLSLAEKMERLHRLQELQHQISAERLKAWLGKRVEILIEEEGTSKGGNIRGRSSQNIMVNLIDADLDLKPGLLVEAQICEAGKYSLRGEVALSGKAGDNKRGQP